jgi:hypothetical protein
MKKDEVDGWVACMINTCRFVVGNPEGKRPLGRPKRKWFTSKVILNNTPCHGLGS